MFQIKSCRENLSHQDICFIVNAVSKKEKDKEKVLELFVDPACRNIMLDSADLFKSIVDEEFPLLYVSVRLYFYVIIRNLLKDYGIDDRDVADYVSELLCRYSLKKIEATYVFEMIEKEINAKSDLERFMLLLEKADSLLVLTGIFPEFVEYRKRRKGAPGIEFYEEIGANTYLDLSNHTLAFKNDLSGKFNTLGSDFHRIRSSLNCVM